MPYPVVNNMQMNSELHPGIPGLLCNIGHTHDQSNVSDYGEI